MFLSYELFCNNYIFYCVSSARGRQARTSAVTSGTYASSLYNAMVAQAPTLDYNANYAMGK